MVRSSMPMQIHHIATLIFAVAILQTFIAKSLEMVFPIWALILIGIMWIMTGTTATGEFITGLELREPVFVAGIMILASTPPVLWVGEELIYRLSFGQGIVKRMSFFWLALVIGPILGSFITEPAAMTVTALLLRDRFFMKQNRPSFEYATLGTVFVNISIGGTLTHFSAPPVVMVARAWHWNSGYMISHFGWKSAIAIVLNATLLLLVFRKDFASRELQDLAREHWNAPRSKKGFRPRWKEGVGVGLFLAGLVILGQPQRWWLEPVIRSLSEGQLFLGATALTAVIDNAALTFLGSQVTPLGDAMKNALVAGAVAGGGLTVIANAPNPIGWALLSPGFKRNRIRPVALFLGAALPTAVAMACLWFLA